MYSVESERLEKVAFEKVAYQQGRIRLLPKKTTMLNYMGCSVWKISRVFGHKAA